MTECLNSHGTTYCKVGLRHAFIYLEVSESVLTITLMASHVCVIYYIQSVAGVMTDKDKAKVSLNALFKKYLRIEYTVNFIPHI